MVPSEKGAAGEPLSLFHPMVRQWFAASFGRPTEVQERAWPLIAEGAHVLISAPTGTGKTLAAFLWAIDRLASGAVAPGKVRVLYVSPLKALNNDIQRNLLSPLLEIESLFRREGEPFPSIRVLTRSGDTPAAERRRMLRSPPEILITTPESLNLMLSSPNSLLMLDGIAAVVLDEIHAVAGNKRGTHLMSAVERLVRLSGEFQRIALSATVKPLSEIAEFIGGWVLTRRGGEAAYRKRNVRIVQCPWTKTYELRVDFPDAPPAAAAGIPAEPLWDVLAAECRRIIGEGRSTLLFANSRRHAEKLCRFINEGLGEPIVWSHHGSLSKELRFVVEQRLKRGELKAVAATSSLELGIDIGALDAVVLVQSPFSVASTLQRLGRAGHRVGEPSRGTLFALHGKDIVDAAAIARCVREQDIEEVAPVANPLDVLSQIMVSMTAVETWNAEELFDWVRACASFRELPRRHFDLVLAMLSGRYEETRLRALSPLVSFDRTDGTIRAREGARIRLATSGGTIPDRGYFTLRVSGSRALIGELDEEFVWERSLGDSFVLGTQGWRIQRIDHQDVEVAPVEARTAMSPFWKAEERNRGFHLSDRIARDLEEWNGRAGDPGLAAELEEGRGLTSEAARALMKFLVRQKEATGADLPHRHHLLVEHMRGTGVGGDDRRRETDVSRIVLHTMWGGRVNRPYSLALAAALEEKLGFRTEFFQTDDAILLFLPEDIPAEELLSLVNAGNLHRLLRKRLEGSGFFGARFRECAGRALLLPRSSARRRTPLWLTRLRAKALFSAVSKYEDFPMLIEAWRACLQDEFDLANLLAVLGELASGAIRISELSTPLPSPFCGDLVWKQTNAYMYADDSPETRTGTALRPDLVRELALSTELRPRIARETARLFQEKLQRTAEGYAPRDERDLLDWVKERVVVSRGEWERLLAASERDHGLRREDAETALAPKIVDHAFDSEGGPPAICSREVLPRILKALAEVDESLADLASQWLRFYGPIEPSLLQNALGLSRDRFDTLLEDLVAAEAVVLDRLLEGSEEILLCDRENLEMLLRISRSSARPQTRTLPLETLSLFIASFQGLARRGAGIEDMKERWERIFGFGLQARLWEEEILPARLREYHARWLDTLIGEAGILWLGCGKEKIAFCFDQDAELFSAGEARSEESEVRGDVTELFPRGSARHGFWDLVDSSKLGSTALAERLWTLAWRGEVSADSFQPVRRGLENGFRAEQAASEGGKRRRGFDRWRTSRPSAGYWFRVDRDPKERDALDTEELNRDRIRQALVRYGVVFREILENELPLLRWPRLFRSLRLMEFSGEVVSGRFFDGVPGLQFASAAGLAALSADLPEDAVYWMNAVDPASLCGVAIDDLKTVLPARRATTQVVFHGSKVVLVSRRTGVDLEFRVPPAAPSIPAYLAFVRELTDRDVRPLPSVHVERINGQPVASSPYKGRLLEFGFVEDYRRLVFRARI